MSGVEPNDPVGELSKIPVLAELSQPAFQELSSRIRWVRVEHDRAMVVEAEPIVAMPILVHGLAKLMMGRTLVDLVRGPSLPVPSAIVDGAPSSVSVVAIGAALVGVIERGAFLAAVATSATATIKLAEAGSLEARTYLARIPELAGGAVEERLVALLDRLADRHGAPVDDGRFMPLPLRRSDVAMMIHATTETVSRTLAAWERNGWMRKNRGGIWWATRRAREGGLPALRRPKSDRPEM